MSDYVRCDFARDARLDGVLFHQTLHRTRRDAWQVFALGTTFAIAHEQGFRHVGALFEIRSYRRLRGRGEENDTHLVALAAYSKFIAREVNVAPERAQFRDTQT